MYSLPLNDMNNENMQMKDWKSFVESIVHKEASNFPIYKRLVIIISLEHFQTSDNFTSLPKSWQDFVFKASMQVI